MDRLTYRDDTGRAVLTRYGMRMYCSTQATADCFAHLEEIVERTMPKWISVKERLPEATPAKCLCYSKDGYMVGSYTNWGWMFPCYFGKVTHWMPLPEPPKEGGDEDG